MHKNKSAKRSLLLSALSLLLCMAMLVGTTFAWFTDSVTSGKNKIVAGNLDVELEYAKVVDGNLQDWATVEDKDAIFNPNALWEPGRVEVVYLKVSNLGTLALKYQLGVNVLGETPSVSVKTDKEFKLSDYLVFKTVEMPDALTTYTDREAAQVAAGTEMGLKDYNSKTTTLEVGGTDYVALIVYMPESVGNEANYKKDAPVPTIELGVNLFATQVEAEDDSYGDDYDENAWHPDMIVHNAADLKAGLANGGKIELAADIALTETVKVPADVTVELNLNGKTISGKVAKSAGHVLHNEGKLTITGGKIESTETNGGSAIYNAKGANLNLKGVTVVGAPKSGSDWPSYAINSYGTLAVDGLTLTSNHGAICLYGDAVINNANVTMNGMGGSSHVFYIGGNGTEVVINSGNYTHAGNADGSLAYIMTGTTVTVNGGTFSASNGGYGMATYTGSLIVNGGTFANEFLDWGGPITIAGGTFAKEPKANYIAGGYKTVASNGMYVVVPTEIDTVASTPDELATAIAQGGVVYVAADLDMNNAWTSVKPNGELTILGNGKVITNLNLPLLTGGVSHKVTIKGLTIADSNVGPAANENGLGTGAFIPYVDAYGNVAFEECQLVNTTVTGNERAGGFIGYTSGQSVTIKNCAVENCKISAVGGAAGLIGYSQAVVTIENSSVKGSTLTATEDRQGTKMPLAGAVIGTVNGDTTLTKVTAASNTVSNNNALPAFSELIGRRVTGKVVIDGAEQKLASSQAELNSAVASGNVDVTLADGNYSMPGTSGNVTISGTKDTVITVSGLPNGSNVTFDGVTVKGSGYSTGMNTATATYNDVTIDGTMFLYGEKVVFNHCTFNLSGDYIWTYGAKEVEFNNCTFNTTGKAILIYKDGGLISTKVTVKGCTFNATAPAFAGDITNQSCAAIEMRNYESSITLITEGNTIDSDFSGEWRIKKYDTANNRTITVNGTAYTQTALDGTLLTVVNKEVQ